MKIEEGTKVVCVEKIVEEEGDGEDAAAEDGGERARRKRGLRY